MVNESQLLEFPRCLVTALDAAFKALVLVFFIVGTTAGLLDCLALVESRVRFPEKPHTWRDHKIKK